MYLCFSLSLYIYIYTHTYIYVYIYIYNGVGPSAFRLARKQVLSKIGSLGSVRNSEKRNSESLNSPIRENETHKKWCWLVVVMTTQSLFQCMCFACIFETSETAVCTSVRNVCISCTCIYIDGQRRRAIMMWELSAASLAWMHVSSKSRFHGSVYTSKIQSLKVCVNLCKN